MDLVRRYPAFAPSDGHVVTLDDVDRCARPIHFELEDEVFRYAGNGSSFVAVRDQTWVLFTAAHVVGNANVASVRVLPTDGSRRWLRFERRSRVTSLIEGDTDLADVTCLTIDMSNLKMPCGDVLHGVDLHFPTASPRPGDQLIITGYPRVSRGVDYEAPGITAIGQRIGATYTGRGIGARCHEVELTQLGDLNDFDGFSGSPVYWIGDREGDLATVRLAGMVLRGNVFSRRAHYIEAAVVLAVAETASTGVPTNIWRGGNPSVDPRRSA